MASVAVASAGSVIVLVSGVNDVGYTGAMAIRVIAVLLVALAAGFLLFRGDAPSRVSIDGRSFDVTVADEVDEWAQGLSGRPGLADDEGMLFLFPYAARRDFWMKDMQFAIDIIWLRGGTVLGITRNVQPQPGVPESELVRYPSPDTVDAVLEVAAGEAADIEVGDVVVY